MTNESDSRSPQKPPQRLALLGILLQWVIFLALAVWALSSLWPQQTTSVALPYSAFVEQVQAGNVSAVTIAGSDITGQFAQPVAWPRPTPAASPVPPPGDAT